MNLVLSMAVRLESGSVFPTFEHFLETFNAYFHANKELFVRKNTVTVEAANKTIKREENKFPAAWVYKAIQFQCKHYSTQSCQRRTSWRMPSAKNSGDCSRHHWRTAATTSSSLS